LAEHREDTVYLVLDDFGAFGRAYRETGEGRADRQTLLANLLSGQYERPLRIVAFNTAEAWARDVTAEIAREVQARTRHDDDHAPALREFIDRALSSSRLCAIGASSSAVAEAVAAIRVSTPARRDIVCSGE
jgi:hypothetical protein